MRRVSVRRRELLDIIGVERDAFQIEWPCCWICGEDAADVHEIARGANRAQALGERCAWVRCCRSCHEALGDYGRWPVVWQYGLKLLWDAEHYDRLRLNRLRGRAPEAVTDDEVRAALPDVLGSLTALALRLSVAQRP